MKCTYSHRGQIYRSEAREADHCDARSTRGPQDPTTCLPRRILPQICTPDTLLRFPKPLSDGHRYADPLSHGGASLVRQCTFCSRNRNQTHLFNDRLKRIRTRDHKSLERNLRRFKTPVQGAHVVGLGRGDASLDLLLPSCMCDLGLTSALFSKTGIDPVAVLVSVLQRPVILEV